MNETTIALMKLRILFQFIFYRLAAAIIARLAGERERCVFTYRVNSPHLLLSGPT